MLSSYNIFKKITRLSGQHIGYTTRANCLWFFFFNLKFSIAGTLGQKFAFFFIFSGTKSAHQMVVVIVTVAIQRRGPKMCTVQFMNRARLLVRILRFWSYMILNCSNFLKHCTYLLKLCLNLFNTVPSHKDSGMQEPWVSIIKVNLPFLYSSTKKT